MLKRLSLKFKLTNLYQFTKYQRNFSNSDIKIPVIDTSNPSNFVNCKKAVESFEKYGIMVIRDPRVDQKKNSDFLDMMENYYEEVSKKYYMAEYLQDTRPKSGYNIGLIPERMERARNHSKKIQLEFRKEKPMTPQPPPKDKKWRFQWRIGSAVMEGKGHTGENVIPEGFEKIWEPTMNEWGNLMKDCVMTVSEMLARGFELHPNTFVEMFDGGNF